MAFLPFVSKKKPQSIPHLELLPGIGVGPIRLGMKRADVRAAMKAVGLPSFTERGSSDFFDALQVEYTDDTASFIGVSWSPTFTCSIYGVSPFDTSARELFSLLAKRNGGTHHFNEDEYLFPNIIVALYEAAEQYNHTHGTRPPWGQVGVGDARYLAAVGEPRARSSNCRDANPEHSRGQQTITERGAPLLEHVSSGTRGALRLT
jgi:hypothetical protein